MRLSRFLPIPRTLLAFTAAGVMLTAVAASAQDKVTVMLRSGEKVSGDLEDLNQNTLFVRVTQHDQRKLPIGDVAVIDFVGGASGLPETELSQARGDDHLLVMRSSDLIAGRLVDISGGAGSDKPDEARLFIFRTTGGEERRVPVGQVGRVYVGRYPGNSADLSPPADAQGVKVAANQGWVATGVYVTAGQQVSFGTQGEVQLSGDANDRATAAGSKSGRHAAGAPMPGILAGALIGRVGTNGAPFGIGDQQAVPMPASGELFLAVNDDDRNDNAGAFAVTVTPAQTNVLQRNPR